MAAALVLAHSPLTGPAAWGTLPEALRERGHRVVVLDVHDDTAPPYATSYVARAALQLREECPAGPVALVGHSGAGYLLPQIGAARRAARTPVSAYVFLDAGIPHARGATRLSLLHEEDPVTAREVEAHLRAGGTFPEWTEDDLRGLVKDGPSRHALLRSLRPRALDFFVEELPFPGDWPDAPCGYLQLSPAYERPARLARLRGWPVTVSDLASGHFAACVEPAPLAAELDRLLSVL